MDDGGSWSINESLSSFIGSFQPYNIGRRIGSDVTLNNHCIQSCRSAAAPSDCQTT